MGSLIKSIGHTEVNATLELLDQFGVTTEGLKLLRTKTPPAVIKQLVRFIEAGTVSDVVALSAFPTFNAPVGSPSLEKMEHEWICGEKRSLDDLGVGVLGKLLPSLPAETHSFILMEFADFAKFPTSQPTLKQLTDTRWLGEWSEKNLVGINLELCRRDTAPYLGHLKGELWNSRELWVATEPLRNGGSKTMFRLENCDNGMLRLQLKDFTESEDRVHGCTTHIVFRIGKK